MTFDFNVTLFDGDTNEEIWTGPANEFYTDNDEDEEVGDILMGLVKEGDEAFIGGGAAAEFRVKRTS
jgi:hypothetical protein